MIRQSLAWGSLVLLACSGPARYTPGSVDVDASPDDGLAASTSSPDAADTSPAPLLAIEAGFLQVGGQPNGSRAAARLFYSFHPALSAPDRKPLMVFFNGGPGFATSMGLMPYGTAETTLVDPAGAGFDAGAQPVANPQSFARFANLLYLDERNVGFSYELLPKGPACTSFDVLGDAADFTQALLSFLDSHPALQASPVILAGESYGGTRAEAILHILLGYSDPSLGLAPSLTAAIRQHLAAVFRVGTSDTVAPATIAQQFGWMVLVQPLVAGEPQFMLQHILMPNDPYVGPDAALVQGGAAVTFDVYDVTKPAGWSTALDMQAFAALSDPKTAELLLGLPLSSIPELLPAARGSAFRTTCSASAEGNPEEARIAQALGSLGPDDVYMADGPPACCSTDDALDVDPNWLVDALRYTKIFLTHARYDDVIYVPAIPALLQMDLDPALDVTTTPPPGAASPSSGAMARPGWITFTLPASGPAPAVPVTIRYPPYDQSGHMVAVTQGADLADDVEAWLPTVGL